MIEKINSIKNSKHPYSEEINTIITLLDKIFNILLIALNSIGFIIAIVAFLGLTEWADGYAGDAVDVPVNFFGYFIELESDSFAGSPFMVFLHTIIIFTLISLAIIVIKMVIITILKSKDNMLNSLYHSEKLTELLIIKSCNSQSETSYSQSKKT